MYDILYLIHARADDTLDDDGGLLQLLCDNARSDSGATLVDVNRGAGPST